MRQLLVAGLAFAAAFAYWRSSQVIAPSSSTAPAPASVQGSYSGATTSAVGAVATTAARTLARATAPDVPKSVAPGTQVVYGVVYDLGTLGPVARADVRVGRAHATTDERGRYQLQFEQGALEGGAPTEVSVAGYRGAIQERSPSLASLSEARRHGVSEESPRVLGPFRLTMPREVPLGELRLAMLPDRWPGSSAPEFADAAEPPAPAPSRNGACSYYGVVYDLATKKPLRELDLIATGVSGTIQTDRKGRYVAELRPDSSGVPTLSASAAGYRPGLIADLEPPLLTLGPDERRRYAEEHETPGAINLEDDDCEDGLVRLDLVAVPSAWSASTAVAASAVDPARTPVDGLSAFSALAPAADDATSPRGWPLVDPLVTDAPGDPAQASRVKSAAAALVDEQKSLFQAAWASHHSLASAPRGGSTPLGTGENPQTAASATQGSVPAVSTPRRAQQMNIVPSNSTFRK